MPCVLPSWKRLCPKPRMEQPQSSRSVPRLVACKKDSLAPFQVPLRYRSCSGESLRWRHPLQLGSALAQVSVGGVHPRTSFGVRMSEQQLRGRTISPQRGKGTFQRRLESGGCIGVDFIQKGTGSIQLLGDPAASIPATVVPRFACIRLISAPDSTRHGPHSLRPDEDPQLI